MCLFASSIITLVMCVILIWGLYSASVFIFISSIMITLVIIAEITISIIALANKFQTRLTLQEQLPKLGKIKFIEIYFELRLFCLYSNYLSTR
jgi:hypothetical protein